MIIVFLISVLLMVGIRESARANALIVVLKLAVVIVFIGVGWSFSIAQITPLTCL